MAALMNWLKKQKARPYWEYLSVLGYAAMLLAVLAFLLLFAIVFSVLIGLGSGYYPANKAVQIPALEAIKSE